MDPKSILELLLKTPMVVPSKFTNFFWGSVKIVRSRVEESSPDGYEFSAIDSVCFLHSSGINCECFF